jgi:hypothetical protein
MPFAELYEPSKEFTTKFVRNVKEEWKNMSAGADGKKKLIIITNFAEKVIIFFLRIKQFIF